jgi:simple sugar transport system permease protein
MSSPTVSRVLPGAPAERPSRLAVGRLRDVALLPALILLVIIGAFLSPSFLTYPNLVSILGASAALAILVLAESLIILVGKFDLSLESTCGFAPAIGAMLVLPVASQGFGTGWPTWLAMLAVLVIGGVIGLLNGFMVVKLRLNAFIVTLAMLIVLRGMLVGVTKGGTLFDMPDAFFVLATTTILGLPLSVWVAGGAFALAGAILKYHRIGRALYAIGGNAPAARAAGIAVERITTGYVGAINANQGNGMIFTVFAAAVIGGISLDGGRGTMLGALSGVLLLGVVQNLLTLAQVPSFWIQAIYGVIILGSLMAARLTSGDTRG